MFQNCLLTVRSAKTALGSVKTDGQTWMQCCAQREARAVVCGRGSVSVSSLQARVWRDLVLCGRGCVQKASCRWRSNSSAQIWKAKQDALSQAPEAIINVNTTYPLTPVGRGMRDLVCYSHGERECLNILNGEKPV